MSVLPTNHGQSAVMRLLDKDNIRVGVRQLGLSEADFRQFQQLIKRPNGIILVTGPTGSGKTTTLYAALNELNRPDVKIITAEDPVEYYLAGHQSGRSAAQHRARFCEDHSLDVAAGAERDSGRRNARRRNGPDGNSGIFDWTLGFQYTTYERCARCYYTYDRHGGAGLFGLQQRYCSAGAAAGARGLPQVQSSVSAARSVLQAANISKELAAKAIVYEREGVQPLHAKRISGANWHLRIDDYVARKSAN